MLKNILILVITLLFGANFLSAQPTFKGIENSLPEEKHPWPFEEYESVFHRKENPFVKRLMAINPGMTYLGNIPNKRMSSLHKLSLDGKTYLLKVVYNGSRKMPIGGKRSEIIGLPHVMNIYGMKSLEYHDNEGFYFIQLMEFIPGDTLDDVRSKLKKNCPVDLESKLLKIVRQLHDSIIELSSIDIYCGDEKGRNYIFEGEVLKRVDVEGDCGYLNGKQPELDIRFLTWAKEVLESCKLATDKVDSIIYEFNNGNTIKNYQDLNKAISNKI